jgi:hypothetical protein
MRLRSRPRRFSNFSWCPFVNNVEKKFTNQSDYRTNLGAKRLVINSTSSIGATFAADFSLVMSQDNLIHYFPARSYSQVNLGIIKLKQGYSEQKVLSTLISKLYPTGYNIKAMSISEISREETKYWQKNTSLTFIFGIGVIVGFVVSGIICIKSCILTSSVICPSMPHCLPLAIPTFI